MIRMTPQVLSAMEAEARARDPEECCGALLGRTRTDGNGGRERELVRIAPAGNERVTERRRRYLLGPGRFMEVEEEAEREGLDVFGFFHSHPDAAAVPSAFDREHAWPWYSYVIVPVHEGVPGPPRAWTLESDRGDFEEDRIVIEERP